MLSGESDGITQNFNNLRRLIDRKIDIIHTHPSQILPGCSVAIISVGKKSFAHAAGWQKLDRHSFGGHGNITCDTVFQVASISKTVCATLCVLAVRKGYIPSLDASLHSLLRINGTPACRQKYILVPIQPYSDI